MLYAPVNIIAAISSIAVAVSDLLFVEYASAAMIDVHPPQVAKIDAHFESRLLRVMDFILLLFWLILSFVLLFICVCLLFFLILLKKSDNSRNLLEKK